MGSLTQNVRFNLRQFKSFVVMSVMSKVQLHCVPHRILSESSLNEIFCQSLNTDRQLAYSIMSKVGDEKDKISLAINIYVRRRHLWDGSTVALKEMLQPR